MRQFYITAKKYYKWLHSVVNGGITLENKVNIGANCINSWAKLLVTEPFGKVGEYFNLDVQFWHFHFTVKFCLMLEKFCGGWITKDHCSSPISTKQMAQVCSLHCYFVLMTQRPSSNLVTQINSLPGRFKCFFVCLFFNREQCNKSDSWLVMNIPPMFHLNIQI